MFERLDEVAARYAELEQRLAIPETAADPNLLRQLSTELASIRDTVTIYVRWRQLGVSLDENRCRGPTAQGFDPGRPGAGIEIEQRMVPDILALREE